MIIDLIRMFIHKKRFKKGDLVKVVDKSRKLKMIGVYSEVVDNNVVKLYMTYHLDDPYGFMFLNTRVITVDYKTIKKPSSQEITTYIDLIQTKFDLHYFGNGKFWKHPSNYKEGEKFILPSSIVNKKLMPTIIGHFSKTEKHGSIDYVYSTDFLGYPALSIFPEEYNRTWC